MWKMRRRLGYIQMKQQESRGKRNWRKLQNIIRSGTLRRNSRGKKFNLFNKECKYMQNHILTQYSYGGYKLLQKTPLPTYKELLHFQSEVDATGKWVWEAEEVAAFFFLSQGEVIITESLTSAASERQQLSILELGAGSSGLAGLALGNVAIQQFKGFKVGLQLTDGQLDNIKYLQQNLKINFGQKELFKAEKLLWGDAACLQNLSEPMQSRKKFDIIIICDCLYFVDYHKELIITLQSYLGKLGSVYLINPARGQSMKIFLELAAHRGFIFEYIEFKNQKFQMQLCSLRSDIDFIEDEHSPFFLRLFKSRL